MPPVTITVIRSVVMIWNRLAMRNARMLDQEKKIKIICIISHLTICTIIILLYVLQWDWYAQFHPRDKANRPHREGEVYPLVGLGDSILHPHVDWCVSGANSSVQQLESAE